MALIYKWKNTKSKEVSIALEIVFWLKQQGITSPEHYTWFFDPPSEETCFRFNEKYESYASLIALKFL